MPSPGQQLASFAADRLARARPPVVPLQNRLTQQVAAASGRAQSACPGSDGCGQLLRCDLGAGLLDKPGSHYEGTTTRVNGRSRRSTPCGLGRLNPRANPNQVF